MDNICKGIKKVCGFYVSGMHLITMILPYIKNQINNNVTIETVLEYNLNDNVNKIMSNLIINEKEKNNILSINWNSNKIQKYSYFEKRLLEMIEKSNEMNILVSGSRKHIDQINIILNKFFNRNNNKLNGKIITIINCYEVKNFDDNIREILNNHQFIINTSGIHKTEDVFEDYKKERVN